VEEPLRTRLAFSLGSAMVGALTGALQFVLSSYEEQTRNQRGKLAMKVFQAAIVALAIVAICVGWELYRVLSELNELEISGLRVGPVPLERLRLFQSTLWASGVAAAGLGAVSFAKKYAAGK
jgi:hypothetical protein